MTDVCRFTNLNQACPKDYFLLPKINQLVDATIGFGYLISLDAYLEYHWILMDPEDEEKIAFYNKCENFLIQGHAIWLEKC